MRKTSLLGHLIINKFGNHSENIATEALNHILSSSAIAKKSFLRYVEQTSVKLNDNLIFRTQVTDETGAVPDLVGKDSEEQKVLIIESKFWAGLTPNQPVVYLKQLPQGKSGVLLFIAPVKRIFSLWAELLRRCKNDNIIINEMKSPVSNEFLIAHSNEKQCLAIASWRSVLSFILKSVETEGENDAASDIAQLQGLVEQMDEKAFLPLHSEDFAPIIAARVIQYCNLVDEVTSSLVKNKLASTKDKPTSAGRLTTARGLGIHGRYMKINGFACCLQFNASLWSTKRETPLWLSIKGGDWKFSQSAKKCLSKLELKEPSCLLEINEELFIPLYLPIEVERDEVINNLISQIKEIAEYLKDGTP